MILGYPTGNMVFRSKGQRSRSPDNKVQNILKTIEFAPLSFAHRLVISMVSLYTPKYSRH